MSKFTPGPWQFHGSHFYTADPERKLLGQVIENPEHNRRLIAAAPDLLEALEMARAMIGNPVHEADIPCYEQIDAAIAKATKGDE